MTTSTPDAAPQEANAGTTEITTGATAIGTDTVDPEHGRLRRFGRAGVLLSCGWLGFTLAQHVLSGRWWLWTAVDMLPPAVFLVVPVLLVGAGLGLRGHRRPVIAVAVLALLIGEPVSGLNLAALRPDSSTGAASTAGGSGTIRVVSWNTEYWDQTDDPTAFFDYLKSFDADVYLLQEYLQQIPTGGGQSVLGRVDDAARLRQEFPGYQVISTGELLTLSRLPVLSSRPVDGSPWMTAARHSLPPTDTPTETDFPDLYRFKSLRTDVQVGTKTVSLYNVHLPVQLSLNESPLGARFYQIMREDDGQRRAGLSALTSDLDGNQLPVFVAGDFNTSPSMGTLRPLEHRLTDRTGVLRSIYPTSWGIAGLRLWRLDRIFTSSDVDVQKYRFENQRQMSDHRAQVAQITLKN